MGEGWEWIVPQMEESKGSIHRFIMDPSLPNRVPGANNTSVMTPLASLKNPANSSGCVLLQAWSINWRVSPSMWTSITKVEHEKL